MTVTVIVVAVSVVVVAVAAALAWGATRITEIEARLADQRCLLGHLHTTGLDVTRCELDWIERSERVLGPEEAAQAEAVLRDWEAT